MSQYEPLPFYAIRHLYDYKRNIDSVQVCHTEKFGPWPWSGSYTVKCDPESAYALGRQKGFAEAIELIYQLEEKV